MDEKKLDIGSNTLSQNTKENIKKKIQVLTDKLTDKINKKQIDGFLEKLHEEEVTINKLDDIVSISAESTKLEQLEREITSSGILLDVNELDIVISNESVFELPDTSINPTVITPAPVSARIAAPGAMVYTPFANLVGLQLYNLSQLNLIPVDIVEKWGEAEVRYIITKDQLKSLTTNQFEHINGKVIYNVILQQVGLRRVVSETLINSIETDVWSIAINGNAPDDTAKIGSYDVIINAITDIKKQLELYAKACVKFPTDAELPTFDINKVKYIDLKAIEKLDEKDFSRLVANRPDFFNEFKSIQIDRLSSTFLLPYIESIYITKELNNFNKKNIDSMLTKAISNNPTYANSKILKKFYQYCLIIGIDKKQCDYIKTFIENVDDSITRKGTNAVDLCNRINTGMVSINSITPSELNVLADAITTEKIKDISVCIKSTDWAKFTQNQILYMFNNQVYNDFLIKKEYICLLSNTVLERITLGDIDGMITTSDEIVKILSKYALFNWTNFIKKKVSGIGDQLPTKIAKMRNDFTGLLFKDPVSGAAIPRILNIPHFKIAFNKMTSIIYDNFEVVYDASRSEDDQFNDNVNLLQSGSLSADKNIRLISERIRSEFSSVINTIFPKTHTLFYDLTPQLVGPPSIAFKPEFDFIWQLLYVTTFINTFIKPKTNLTLCEEILKYLITQQKDVATKKIERFSSSHLKELSKGFLDHIDALIRDVDGNNLLNVYYAKESQTSRIEEIKKKRITDAILVKEHYEVFSGKKPQPLILLPVDPSKHGDFLDTKMDEGLGMNYITNNRYNIEFGAADNKIVWSTIFDMTKNDVDNYSRYFSYRDILFNTKDYDSISDYFNIVNNYYRRFLNTYDRKKLLLDLTNKIINIILNERKIIQTDSVELLFIPNTKPEWAKFKNTYELSTQTFTQQTKKMAGIYNVVPQCVIITDVTGTETKYELDTFSFCGAAKCIFYYRNTATNKYLLLGLFTLNTYLEKNMGGLKDTEPNLAMLSRFKGKIDDTDPEYEAIISHFIRQNAVTDYMITSEIYEFRLPEIGYVTGYVNTMDVGFIDLEQYPLAMTAMPNNVIKHSILLKLMLYSIHMILEMYNKGLMYVDLKLQNVMFFIENDKMFLKFIDVGSVIPTNLKLAEVYSTIFIQNSKANCAGTTENQFLPNFHKINEGLEDQNIYKKFLYDVNKNGKDPKSDPVMYSSFKYSYMMNIMYYVINMFVYYVTGENFEGDFNREVGGKSIPDVPNINILINYVQKIQAIDSTDFKAIDEPLIPLFVDILQFMSDWRYFVDQTVYFAEIDKKWTQFLDELEKAYTDSLTNTLYYVLNNDLIHKFVLKMRGFLAYNSMIPSEPIVDNILQLDHATLTQYRKRKWGDMLEIAKKRFQEKNGVVENKLIIYNTPKFESSVERYKKDIGWDYKFKENKIPPLYILPIEDLYDFNVIEKISVEEKFYEHVLNTEMPTTLVKKRVICYLSPNYEQYLHQLPGIHIAPGTINSSADLNGRFSGKIDQRFRPTLVTNNFVIMKALTTTMLQDNLEVQKVTFTQNDAVIDPSVTYQATDIFIHVHINDLNALVSALSAEYRTLDYKTKQRLPRVKFHVTGMQADINAYYNRHIGGVHTSDFLYNVLFPITDPAKVIKGAGIKYISGAYDGGDNESQKSNKQPQKTYNKDVLYPVLAYGAWSFGLHNAILCLVLIILGLMVVIYNLTSDDIVECNDSQSQPQWRQKTPT